MTHCCPQCKDHPILSDVLGCIFCGGRYVWNKKDLEAKRKYWEEKYKKKIKKNDKRNL